MELPKHDLPETADKFGRTIRVGSRVRSYDFPDTTPERMEKCFVEGVVEGCVELEGCLRYVVRVDRTVFDGQQDATPDREQVLPPLNGTQKLLGGACNGVVSLDPLSADEVLEAAQEALRPFMTDPKVARLLEEHAPEALARVQKALNAIDSNNASMEAHLDDLFGDEGDRLDALDRAMGGDREWDNAVLDEWSRKTRLYFARPVRDR